jgi:hypothetical protein
MKREIKNKINNLSRTKCINLITKIYKKIEKSKKSKKFKSKKKKSYCGNKKSSIRKGSRYECLKKGFGAGNYNGFINGSNNERNDIKNIILRYINQL